MKTALAMAALILTAGMAGATTFGLTQGSKLWIEGNSTLHAWESTATSLDAAASVDAASLSDAIAKQTPIKLTLTVPVAGMKSEHSGLDKNLRKALQADKNPNIVFTMSAYQEDSKSGTISADGQLTVAGVTKPETITAKLAAKDGRLVLDGQQPLLMTDFEVTPPTAMMGTIKADDHIVVKFHVELEPIVAANSTKEGK